MSCAQVLRFPVGCERNEHFIEFASREPFRLVFTRVFQLSLNFRNEEL